MKKSNKIINAETSPRHKFSGGEDYNHKLEVKLPHHKSSIVLYFKIVKAEEEMLDSISYMFKSDVENNGIFELYFQMITKRAIESLDRVTTKEFDHYMRDSSSELIFNYYDDQFYEVLGLGEEILRYLHPKKKKETIYNGTKDEFLALSFSEQIEIFEELFVKYIYNHPTFHKFEIDIEDILGDEVVTNIPKESRDLSLYLCQKVEEEFGFILKFRN